MRFILIVMLFLFILIVMLFLAAISNADAQKKDRLVDEIEQVQLKAVANAVYRAPYNELWANLYAVISEKYRIARESETRGFISTEKQVDPGPYTVEGEIVGSDSAHHVIIKCVTKIPEKWAVKIENQLKVKFYTRMNGNIPLSQDLRKRIEEFNAQQTSDKKKVIEGRDY